jgi:hypothetical protein
MREFEIWGCPDRLRSAGNESPEHLWGKFALDRRKREERDPWFPGEYRFERTVADRVPDCMILGEGVNRWIEFVAGSEQPYREKTREALRLGFVIYWVFHKDHDEQRRAARQALEPELADPFELGVYDPWGDVLKLGTPITYKNYEFPVESMAEFRPKLILGYRAGAARIGRLDDGLDLGMFEIAGCQRRLITNGFGSYFRAIAPNQQVEEAPWGWPTRDGLKRLVEAGRVRRLGPVGSDD